MATPPPAPSPTTSKAPPPDPAQQAATIEKHIDAWLRHRAFTPGVAVEIPLGEHGAAHLTDEVLVLLCEAYEKAGWAKAETRDQVEETVGGTHGESHVVRADPRGVVLYLTPPAAPER